MKKIVLPHSIKERSAIILVTKELPCLFTLKKILDSSCKVNGVIFCDRKKWIDRLKKEIRDIKNYGLIKRLSQIFLSIYFYLIHSKSDKDYLKNCYNNFDVDEVFSSLILRNIDFIFTSDYQSVESLRFIKKKSPDFLVSHTPYWIGKKVREISKEKIVIGSHPGLVPFYRGAHSAFWCIYDEEPEKNGYSIFCLNQGVDSGPLIKQEKICYIKEISYRSNDYLLMKHMSVAQAKIVESYSNGQLLTLTNQNNLNPSQIKKAPGIIDYFRFRLKQNLK
tara:strand:+ start:204 stop:1037 length:834 start_codon:yes stop_codon:yes gene_type:complete